MPVIPLWLTNARLSWPLKYAVVIRTVAELKFALSASVTASPESTGVVAFSV